MLLDLYLSFAKIGLFTFGGGYAMLPMIELDLIAGKGWLTMTEFTNIVAIAEVTPGPIAVNSATFVGYRLAGTVGGIVATLGVITPSVVIILILAALAKRLENTKILAWIKGGIRPAVVGLIAAAALSVASVSINNIKSLAVAGAAAYLVFRVKLHPVLVLALSGLLGILVFSM